MDDRPGQLIESPPALTGRQVAPGVGSRASTVVVRHREGAHGPHRPGEQAERKHPETARVADRPGLRDRHVALSGQSGGVGTEQAVGRGDVLRVIGPDDRELGGGDRLYAGPGKIATCYANSVLFQEKRLAPLEDWTPSAIEHRRDEILTWARSRWYVPPAKTPSAVLVDDDERDELNEPAPAA